MFKKIVLSAVVALVLPLVLLGAGTARAAEIKTGKNINLNKSEKNIYAFGTSITTDADIKGDLIALSQTVNISRDVENSVIAGGSNVKITGSIGNNVKIFSGITDIDGKIGGDLIIFAGTITISDKTEIGGDLIVFGGNINVNGKIKGKAKIYGDNVTINGTIDGNVEIKSDNIDIPDRAAIGGKLTYWSTKDANVAISPNAKITGGVEKKEVAVSKKGILALGTAAAWYSLLISLVGAIILALVALYVRPEFIRKAVLDSLKNPLNPLWKGFVGIIIVPIVAIILLMTMFGALLGLATGVIYLALLIIAYAISIIITGSFAVKLMNRSKKYEIGWLQCLVGAVVLVIISWIPSIGPLIWVLIFLVAFGAILEQVLKVASNQKAR